MTLRDVIAAKKFKLMVLVYSGFVLFAVGAILGQKIKIMGFVAILGFAVAFVCMVLFLLRVRCPKCNGNLGLTISQSRNPFKVSADIRYCPYCGIAFDTQMA